MGEELTENTALTVMSPDRRFNKKKLWSVGVKKSQLQLSVLETLFFFVAARRCAED